MFHAAVSLFPNKCLYAALLCSLSDPCDGRWTRDTTHWTLDTAVVCCGWQCFGHIVPEEDEEELDEDFDETTINDM